MNNCPHCGSANSFEYTAILITKRVGFWGENNDEESEVKDSKFPKTVQCGDCGKRVKWDVAHGLKTARDGVVRIKNIGGGTFVDADDPRPARPGLVIIDDLHEGVADNDFEDQ